MRLDVLAGVSLAIVAAGCVAEDGAVADSELGAVESGGEVGRDGEATAPVFPTLTCNSRIYGEAGYRIRVETRYNAGCQYCGPVTLSYDWGDGTADSRTTSQPSGTVVIRHTYPPSPGGAYSIYVDGVSEATGATCHETWIVLFN